MSGSSVAPWGLLREHEKSTWDITTLLKYMRCEKRFDQGELVGLIFSCFRPQSTPFFS